MVIHGSRSVFMVPRWFFMVPGRFLWLFMALGGFHDSRWVIMVIHGSRSVSMVPGWFFMIPGGFSWFSIILDRFSWFQFD